MKRRGFLGLLGGAAVAGPSMAKQAVASMAELSLPSGLAINGGLSTVASQLAYPTAPLKAWSPASEAADLGQMLIDLMGRKDHEQRAAKQYINGLDPDLAVNRSMALHAKMAIQRRREYWRSVETERSWLQQRIDQLLKQVAA